MRRAAIMGAAGAVAVLAAAVGFLIVRRDHGEAASLVPATSAAPSTSATSTTPATTTTTSMVASTTSTTSSLPSADTSTTAAPAPVIDPRCPDSMHGAFVDRMAQRGGLCAQGVLVREFPVTTARSQPAPRDYDVYAKTLNTSSRAGGHYSTMDHFVAFTYGVHTGARIAFHSVPKLANGEYVQPLESVGTPERLGASAGCVRVLPEDAVAIWDWLNVGDDVRVVN